jgi:V/A-type H+-transporting ATPase subunit D
MPVAPSRWRLIELKRRRDAVRGGIDLLDRKREALIRQLVERRGHAEELRLQLSAALNAARGLVRRAFEEIGRPGCEAAALAQISPAWLEVRDDRVLGVPLPLVRASLEPFHICYGPGGTAASVDDAARAFAGLIPALLRLASQETAIRNLQRGLQRTTRTLNALKDMLLPELEADIRTVAAGLEEEERDERARWTRRLDFNPSTAPDRDMEGSPGAFRDPDRGAA